MNPKTSSSERKNPKHASGIIPKGTVRGNERSAKKMPNEKLTRQKTSRRNSPDRCARSNNPRSKTPSTKKDSSKVKSSYYTFEVGECSGTKDDSGRVIKEEESEVEETEGLEIVSEHEMLRKLKRKPKSKEKCYRDKMCSGHQSEKVLGKKDTKDSGRLR